MSMEEDGRFVVMLDDCCRRTQEGQPLERCLDYYPAEFRAELARLVPLTGRLGQLGRDPSSAFAARLEQELLASVDRAGREHRWGWWQRFRSRLVAAAMSRLLIVVVAILVVLVGGTTGVTYAAGTSLPDSPLYKVRLAKEWVQLAVAGSGPAVINVRASQLERRVADLDRVVRTRKARWVVAELAVREAELTTRMVNQALDLKARGNPQPAQRALQAVTLMQRNVSQLLTISSPRDRLPLQRLRQFLDTERHRLEQQN